MLVSWNRIQDKAQLASYGMVSEVSNGHHSDRYCQVPCQTCMEVYKAIGYHNFPFLQYWEFIC